MGDKFLDVVDKGRKYRSETVAKRVNPKLTLGIDCIEELLRAHFNVVETTRMINLIKSVESNPLDNDCPEITVEDVQKQQEFTLEETL